jgi:hypothetical protein
MIRYFYASLLAVGVLSLAACDTLKGLFGETQSQLEAVVAVTAAGTYQMTYTVTKDGKALLTQTVVYECTQEAGKLTGCHKR